MIVCLCHGVTERQMREAMAAGGCSTSEVYRRLGLRPNCASCVPFVCDALREARGKDASQSLPTPLPMAVAAE